MPTLDQTLETLETRPGMTAFDKKIYELLIFSHRLPYYCTPRLQLLAMRSNQTEDAVIASLLKLRAAGLARVVTDPWGYPQTYRVIDPPPAPPTPEPAAKPIPTQPELIIPKPVEPVPQTTYITVKIQERYCITNETTQDMHCDIIINKDQTPEPTEEQTEPVPATPKPANKKTCRAKTNQPTPANNWLGLLTYR